MATVNFASVDNPPVVDLNGPAQAGRNYTTQYSEGSQPVSVRMAHVCSEWVMH